MPADSRVPGYLGRVLDAAGTPAGTCFQVAPGVLVTAWHVLNDLGAGDEGAAVAVDALDGSAGCVPAEVLRVDPVHDLAVLRRAEPLGSSLIGLVATDVLALRTEVVVTGVSGVDDPEHDYRFLDAVGTWSGGTMRNDQVPLGRLSSASVVPGMSGSPVRRSSDDVVVGVVSARYNSADGWLRDSVWVARTEDLEPLLAGLAPVEVGGRPPLGDAVDLVLTVSATEVTLTGAGLDVAAAHQGVTPGLAEAINDVQRARTRLSGLHGTATGAVAHEVSLRRVGALLAKSFLPGPVADGMADVLRQAQAEHVPVQVGIAAGDWTWLPWETLPVLGRPLALHPLVTAYRKMTAQPVRPVPGPLRVVVAISAPDTGGGAVLDYERELRNVLAAVRGARAGDAHVRVVPFASTAAIRATLTEEAAHVLHLSGHGQPGALVLEDDSGTVRPVDADTFAEEAIPAGAMPPVISLAACSTAAPAEAGAASFAARLVARGASVVIGTETSVTDRYATQLFARVYGELVATPVPDVVRAVAEARRVVQQQLTESPVERDRELARLDEWSVVTVLAGSGSVPVFDPAVTAPPASRPGPRSVGGLLARDPGEFVGRRREQRRLPTHLISGATAGVVLHGIGGVGKTTLAAEIARQVLARDPSRVLAAVSGELTVDQVFGAVTTALRHHLLLAGAHGAGATGPTLQAAEAAGQVDLPWQDRFVLLRDYILDQVPLLVVLDNFEDNLTPAPDGYQVRDGTLAELLAQWAHTPGRSRLLVTCRYEFTLPDGAEAHLSFRHVGPLSVAETFKLIWSLPALDRLDEPELERVWRMVGGHPRTLEYLDALLRGGAGRYHDVTARFTQAVHAKLGREEGDHWLATARDLDAALAESLTLAADDVLLNELLSTLQATPHAERLLLGASVYREPVDTNALLFQIGDPDEAAGYTPDPDNVKQYADDVMVAAGFDLNQPVNPAEVTPEVRAKMSAHIDSLSTPRPPRSTSVDIDWLTGLLAKTSLLATNPDEATVFVHRWTALELERRYQIRGHHEKVRRAHQQAAEYWQWRFRTWPQDQKNRVHDLLEARHHLLTCGDVEQAGSVTESACSQLQTWGAWDHVTALIHDTLARLAPNSPRRPVWMHHQGILAQFRGDYEQAEHCYRQALQIYKESGNQVEMADTYHQLGTFTHMRHEHEEAERYYQMALQTFEQLGEQAKVAVSYHQLGMLANDRGDDKDAERRYQQALHINEKLDDQEGIASSYHQLGNLAYSRGDHERAGRLWRQSLQINEKLGNQDGMAGNYHQLGMLAEHRGDNDDAARFYQRSLQINEKLGRTPEMAKTYSQLGALAQERSDYEEAKRRYRQTLQIMEQLGDQSGIARSYHRLGGLAAQQGNYDEAEHFYFQSLDISGRLGDSSAQTATWSHLGNVAIKKEWYNDAIAWHIYALLVRLEDPASTSNIRTLAALRKHMGHASFVAAAGKIIDGMPANIQAMLEPLLTIDQDEQEAE